MAIIALALLLRPRSSGQRNGHRLFHQRTVSRPHRRLSIDRGPAHRCHVSIGLDLRLFPQSASLQGSVRMQAIVTADSLSGRDAGPVGRDGPGFGPHGRQRVPPSHATPPAFSSNLHGPARRVNCSRLTCTTTARRRRPGSAASCSLRSTEGPWIWSLSQPYGARDWWPCKDHQLDKADSADIIVTCPNGLRVGSNGLLRSTTDNGNGTTTFFWAERYPIATYLISIAVGPYASFSNWYRYGPIGFHGGPELRPSVTSRARHSSNSRRRSRCSRSSPGSTVRTRS